MFDKCKLCMEDALQGAKMEKHDIDDIVMIGGSTRIPAIQELVKEFFNVEKLNFKLNPDQAVAIGAAIHAASIPEDAEYE